MQKAQKVWEDYKLQEVLEDYAKQAKEIMQGERLLNFACPVIHFSSEYSELRYQLLSPVKSQRYEAGRAFKKKHNRVETIKSLSTLEKNEEKALQKFEKERKKIDKKMDRARERMGRKEIRKNYGVSWKVLEKIKDLGMYSRNGNTSGLSSSIVDFKKGKKLFLVKTSGWAEYSKAFGSRYREFYSLVGWEKENQEWFTLAVGKVETVEDAQEWVKPAKIKKAEKEGKKVLQQGDVYVVPTKRQGVLKLGRHVYNSETKKLEHPEHSDISIDYPFTLVPQKTTAGARLD